jgi:flavin-dependent dehydrogenase
MNPRVVEISGAGPAGLSAALAARARGAEVTVYEARSDAGARFHGDFQGLENWTSETDVIAELANFGIRADFSHTPVYEVVWFDPDGVERTVNAASPIFYLVRRGRDPGTLDQALKAQALEAGITIRFNQRRRHLPERSLVAEGPHRADVIVTGYVFETDMADGCYVAIAERLSPGGYSYLLVNKGRGTIAACLFDRFHDERQYLEATVAFFKRNVGVRWHTAQRYGGTGNYHCVERAVLGNRLYAGEAAGFQDALFGFGLRYALVSGYLAGSADGSALAYEDAWHRRLSGLNSASILNRWLYARLGDRGRKFLFRKALTGQDPRHFLGRIYKSAYWKTLIAKCLPSQPLLHSEHFLPGCDCTWCRCQIHASALDEDTE